ncbi:lasso peptide biosynthesis PqqD family chaperone [Streptomyces albireticuli]|uniref:PqqD family protein n=1 Tax=Streptomyces albireticuli TaxID=1940 RepID=A0A2A2D0Z5_9ACTN|nr:lasso peptide biosynthesis PqqD family chaperone [Streptomyces albireticuli]MCD9145738.1 lasso peptide biosynthesis PqqD family chaperone [Streptomyces albireticuli]MCD9165530.1 lasso peptide biosynthesis PqqD family chaperone [Streptomyces albireticuli]MCD9195947.1 lasso peptide biosynthesis PqqD family chaperone [Streptomyces albireticuli]PAU45185.1 PqqD family protein [Streptomyces albireticuli]
MLTLRPGVLLTETEYGMALLDQKSAEYWTLNPTAALVLRTLLDGHGAERAVDLLTTRYEGIDTARAAEDVDRIVSELRGAGLLTP